MTAPFFPIELVDISQVPLTIRVYGANIIALHPLDVLGAAKNQRRWRETILLVWERCVKRGVPFTQDQLHTKPQLAGIFLNVQNEAVLEIYLPKASPIPIT